MTSKLVFISHNKADKLEGRLLATSLVQQGVGVWFDEWDILPGDSIVGGIEEGLSEADVFVLVWSSNASKSEWVGTELQAYLVRRVNDQTLRIVPIMLDETPLPVLVADYRGFEATDQLPLEEIAARILGERPDREIARLLQSRLLELSDSGAGYPFPYLVCPDCGSSDLEHMDTHDKRGDHQLVIYCKNCDWGESTEI